MIGQVPDHLVDAAYLALQEGRLAYRCTNAQGRPCNGGSADPIPLGEWSPEVPDPKICERGWHLTTDPLLWRGTRVWICEGEGLAPVGRAGDKTCWRRIRPLAEVDPKTAICWRARVAAMRPDLRNADLREVDLRRADLENADLNGANLRKADLRRADLAGANLWGADLGRADLRDADLRRAYLQDADLGGAILRGATLRDAILRGTTLQDADLREADLRGADLRGADLRGADLRGALLQGARLPANLRDTILGD